MTTKILSLVASIGAIILGAYLSINSNRLFYGLMLAGVLYGIYDIYLIVTHNRKVQEQQNTQKKLAEQKTFSNTPSTEDTSDINEVNQSSTVVDSRESATIIVSWFKEKWGLLMGPGMVVTVNGVAVGTVKKDNLHVRYHTNVPFNVITMGIYETEIELSPGDTVEYFIAGNGIRHNRTIITRAGN